MSWQKLTTYMTNFKGKEEEKGGQEVEEGVGPEEENGKEGGEGRVGSCQEGSDN